MEFVSCKDYAALRKQEIKQEIQSNGYHPKLIVVQLDSDSASDAYIREKKADCEEVGIEFELRKCSSKVTGVEAFEGEVSYLSNCPDTSGLIVQYPIPAEYEYVLNTYRPIDSAVDVDGLMPGSMFQSCTAKGIMDWLKYNHYDVAGKDVVVIGRSKLVGKPLVNMLIDAGATVTCCNSKTDLISAYTGCADCVISAVGQDRIWTGGFFNGNQLVIDVGINRGEDGKLHGDVDREDVLQYFPDAYITTVPGGVGLLTRVALLENVLQAYKIWNETDNDTMMERMADSFSMMDEEEKQSWSVESAVRWVLDEKLYAEEHNCRPINYDVYDVYDTIKAMIEAEQE